MLLEANADVDQEAKNDDGGMGLFVACQVGKSTSPTLLAANADIEKEIKLNKCTALNIACQNGQTEVIH